MHGNHLLRLLGLSLVAALSLLALTAANALGEKGVFKINGSPVSSALKAQVLGVPEEQTVFLFSNLNFEIVCKTFTTVEGELLSEGIGSLKLLYEGCISWVTSENKATGEIKLTEELPCKIGHAKFDALLLVISHAFRTYLVAEGKKNAKGETQPLVLFEHKKDPFCPVLPEDPVLRGSEAFQLAPGDLQVGPEVVEPLIKAGSLALQELLKTGVLYGALKVFVHGSARLGLSGAHAGLPWGAI